VWGDWTAESSAEAEAVACRARANRIPLRHVTNGETTKATYTYDWSGNRLTAEYVEGAAYYYAIYEGGIDDVNKPAESLERIWVGDDPSDFVARGTTPDDTPLGGRWIDVDCALSDSGEYLITKAVTCSSCGGGRSYEYVDSQVYLNEEGVATRQYISKVKDASDAILTTYDYDSQDRMIGAWLGDRDKLITQWNYMDAPRIMKTVGGTQTYVQTGDDRVVRLDWIDGAQCRVQEYHYVDGRLVEKRQYQELQEDIVPEGPVSQTAYTYMRDSTGLLTQRIEIHPKGDKTVEYFDGNGNMTKRTRQPVRGSTELVEAQYTYEQIAGRYQVVTSINSRGGTTAYAYDASGNLTRQTDPDPATGQTTGDCLVHRYWYDGDNRMTQQVEDGTRDVTTEYQYDGLARLTKEITDGATTSYTYSLYNELTRTDKPGGQIIRRFYGEQTGVMYGQAVYNNVNTAVSATHYAYDANGRLTKKSLANATSTITGEDLSDLETDLQAANVSEYAHWIHEVYLYGPYGRRTAVVADAGGTNLTTTYAYNNQSEVTKVTHPDGSSTETIRDGRGLVTYQIGIANSQTATTNFAYDANGNLTRKTDPEGVAEYYDYDEFDRRTRVRRGRG